MQRVSSRLLETSHQVLRFIRALLLQVIRADQTQCCTIFPLRREQQFPSRRRCMHMWFASFLPKTLHCYFWIGLLFTYYDILSKPQTNLNTTQDYLNCSWVWYDYDCSPHHPTTPTHQELYPSSSEPAGRCKLTQS